MISGSVCIALLVLCLSYSGATATDLKDCVVDAVLVIDNSASITDDKKNMKNWDFVIKFAQDIAAGINVGPDTSHIGLVDFHSYATMHFDLTEHTTEKEAVKAIGELQHEAYNTNTPEGLQVGRDVLTKAQYGARADVPKIMFIITDGEPSPKFADGLDEEIQKTKEALIRVVAIGVTAEVRVETLQKLASTENDYFIADTFDRLQQITARVLNEDTCKPPPPLPPPVIIPSPPPEPVVIDETTLLKSCDEL